MSLFRRATSSFSSKKSDSPAKEPSPKPTGAENGSAPAAHSNTEPPTVLSNFLDQIKKGLPTMSLETSSLVAVIDGIRNTESIDDRKLLLEHALVFVANLPPGGFATSLQNKIVELLYNDLAHPPATSIGNDYAWRTADGSFNNTTLPDLGKSGTPYARSVQQSHPLPKNELPDPGLIFDALLKRDKFIEHPAGLSSLFFSFAALVIHTVFRTSHTDVNINETSAYVDLSPLYGHDQPSQDQVRLREGRGHLLPDVFAEDRLLLLPPAVCALLVLFSRNHNYIASKLLAINERGTFADPSTLSEEQRAKQDEELFQTARLINCGWFGSVVFSDYFSCILGLIRDGSSWSLDPFSEIRNADHSVFERGKGNVGSVEFNCLYRWHATTSQEDERWVNRVFDKVFDGKHPHDVTPADFKAAAGRIKASIPDITHWTFGDLKRQEDGTFNDEDLANIILTATEHPAGSFGARHTPESMRLHEMMGIEQNRRWGVCSLNDFRKYLGLKPYATFAEWNPDPAVAQNAEKLYGDIERLELYVGLQAEAPKPLVPGAGLCPGYTISRAILSDAISLTRGDRFFTYDYTPFNLTTWGMNDCKRDPNAFGFGSTLGRLFLRTLPGKFTEDSTYTFFPLMTPTAMKGFVAKIDHVKKGTYTFDRPVFAKKERVVSEPAGVKQVAADAKAKTSFAERAALIGLKSKGFYIVNPKEKNHALSALLSTHGTDGAQGSEASIAAYFAAKTEELIKAEAYPLIGGKTMVVDIVRDVLVKVPVYWAAEISGITLKESPDSSGDYTPSELYTMLGTIYEYIFVRPEPARLALLRQKAEAHSKSLLETINGTFGVNPLKAVNRLSITHLSSLFKSQKKAVNGEVNQGEVLKKIKELAGTDDTDTANILFALVVGFVPEMSLALTNAVNFYIDSAAKLVKEDAKQYQKHALDSLKQDPPFQGTYHTLSSGEVVFVDVLAASSVEAPSFPLTRLFTTLSPSLTVAIIGATLSKVFQFPNVTRAPGQSGTLKRFKDDARLEVRWSYLAYEADDGMGGRSGLWPGASGGGLVLQYDAA